ncbi:MAG: branched-chain amino acid ABC transporter permease [Pseudomonadota bacterium]
MTAEALPAGASRAAAFRTLDREHRQAWIAYGVVMLLVWSIPLLSGGFLLYLGCNIALAAVAALGLQLMVGLAGQLSLGHAAFIGIGAYTAVLLEKQAGVSYPLAAMAALVASGLVGFVMAQLVRLSGIYFKIATFGFGIIVYQIMTNWASLTGGNTGLIGIPAIEFLGWRMTSRQDLFVIAASFLTVVYALFVRLTHGRVGRAFRALGQNEDAAQSIGIATGLYKMVVISIGCAVAGLAGSLMPHVYRFVNPESFTWHDSLVLLIMITVGGLGSLPGAVIGAALLVVVPEYLRDLAEYKMLAFGLLLILSMALLPRGLMGLLERRA